MNKIKFVIINLVNFLEYSKVYWQIDSVFESEMYSGIKHTMHCLYYDVMSLLLMFTW